MGKHAQFRTLWVSLQLPRIAVTAVMGCVRYLGLEASPAQERQEQTGVLHKILKRVVAPYA